MEETDVVRPLWTSVLNAQGGMTTKVMSWRDLIEQAKTVSISYVWVGKDFYCVNIALRIVD